MFHDAEVTWEGPGLLSWAFPVHTGMHTQLWYGCWGWGWIVVWDPSTGACLCFMKERNLKKFKQFIQTFSQLQIMGTCSGKSPNMNPRTSPCASAPQSVVFYCCGTPSPLFLNINWILLKNCKLGRGRGMGVGGDLRKNFQKRKKRKQWSRVSRWHSG